MIVVVRCESCSAEERATITSDYISLPKGWGFLLVPVVIDPRTGSRRMTAQPLCPKHRGKADAFMADVGRYYAEESL